MNTYICILRGINVSGNKIIKMDELKNLFQKLKFNEVQTYIQSGNVVFKTETEDTAKLEMRIHTKILEVFGFEVPVIVKSSEQWLKVFKQNPFLMKRNEDITKLHVTFLSKQPEAADIAQLSNFDFGSDEFQIIEEVVYLFCPANGYGNTKLSNQFLETKLKCNATTRNWKTVTQLLAMTKY